MTLSPIDRIDQLVSDPGSFSDQLMAFVSCSADSNDQTPDDPRYGFGLEDIKPWEWSDHTSRVNRLYEIHVDPLMDAGWGGLVMHLIWGNYAGISAMELEAAWHSQNIGFGAVGDTHIEHMERIADVGKLVIEYSGRPRLLYWEAMAQGNSGRVSEMTGAALGRTGINRGKRSIAFDASAVCQPDGYFHRLVQFVQATIECSGRRVYIEALPHWDYPHMARAEYGICCQDEAWFKQYPKRPDWIRQIMASMPTVRWIDGRTRSIPPVSEKGSKEETVAYAKRVVDCLALGHRPALAVGSPLQKEAGVDPAQILELCVDLYKEHAL